MLFPQTKKCNAKHYCFMCMSGFTTADFLNNHKKYCNRVNGRPTRIKMTEERKNTLTSQNYHKPVKLPYMIYADSEPLIRKFHRCERAEGQKGQLHREDRVAQGVRLFIHSCKKRWPGHRTICLQRRERGGSVFKGTSGGGKNLKRNFGKP